MSFNTSFATGFYSGGSQSTLVPSLYSFALDGHAYLIDTAQTGSRQFRQVTIPLLKQQQQTSGNVGAASINPAGLWRMAIETWHKGAGQTNFDYSESDSARFRSSKGVDPWTKWELSLLPDTVQRRSSIGTNLYLQPAGSRLYVTDGNEIRYTTDVTAATPTWTNVSGGPAQNPTSITSDGFNVYTAHGAGRVYKTDTSSSATAVLVNSGGNVSLVRYLKGRLMAAEGASIYNITSAVAAALPTALFTHANSSFSWVDFGEGRNVIYAAGYAGDKSWIYRISIVADGTTLASPVVAGELPDGEIVRSISGYLGFLLIGTDKGIRFATQDSNGDLTIGALITTTSPVYCFEGQGSFVWYGLTNYDSTSTGLGRVSLTTLNGTAPAYASDLMTPYGTTVQGTVQSACTFQSVRVFSVSGKGIYGEDTTKVTSGTLDSGLITFGIPDNKVALIYDVRHASLAGTVAASISSNGSSTFAALGTSSTALATSLQVPAGEVTAEKFELRLTLGRSSTVTTTGPTVTRHVLSVNPTADTGFLLIVPVLLAEADVIPPNPAIGRDPHTELIFIEDLRSSRDVVTVQIGSRTLAASLEDYEFLPGDLTSTRLAYQGTAVLQLKVV